MQTLTKADPFPAVLELMGNSAAATRAGVLLSRAIATSDPVMITAEPGLDPMAVAQFVHAAQGHGIGLEDVGNLVSRV